MIFDKLIIGHGLAALGYLDCLEENKEKICVVDGETFLDSCSLSSTSVVSLSGITLGVSPLGDLLFEAYQKAQAFFDERSVEGVEKASKLYLWESSEEKKKLHQRHKKGNHLKEFDGLNLFSKELLFEDAYLVEPSTFLCWWKKELDSRLGLTIFEDIVLGYQKNEKGYFVIELHSGKQLVCKKLILANGAGNQFIPIEKSYTPKRKTGHFLKWSFLKQTSPSFCLSYGHHNLIWRNQTKELILGVVDNDEDFLFTSRDSFSSLHSLFSKYCPWIPSLNDAEIFVGVRAKGVKRMPKVASLDENLYYIGDFYKNGYSLCFLMGKKLKDLTF